jgi:DNA polymerase-2
VPVLRLTGRLLDLRAGEGGIRIWFRGDDGRDAELLYPFSFSFVLAGKGASPDAVRGIARGTGARLVRERRTELFSGAAMPAWRLLYPSPARQRRAVRLAEAAFGPDALFDADLSPEPAFAFATGLFPFSRASVEADDAGLVLDHRVLDSAWSLAQDLPPLAVATLRTEAPGGHPAHGCTQPLRFVFEGITHELAWEERGGFVRNLARLLRDADPDLVVTEYGDDWLLPRLRSLAQAAGVALPFDRPLAPPGAGPRPPSAAPSEGLVPRKPSRSFVSYGKTVYQAAPHHFFGRWHVDSRNSFLYADSGFEGLAELSRMSGLPVQTMARSSPGTAISAMQVATALSDGVLVPYKKREPEDFKSGIDLVQADTGGLTYVPRPGLLGDVGELDFASMYPSLMARYNLSPETMGCACCRPGIPVPGLRAHACRRRRGLVPRTIAPILEKRAALKALMKSAGDAEVRGALKRRQTALKWLLVVCFGFLGYRNARFGRIEAHEATTAWGREMLLRAKEIAEDAGYEFVHGLTDAIWVRRKGVTRGDLDRLAERITAETGMPIAVEGRYRWILFPPSKQRPSLGVPNRFAGVFEDGETKARGIALRRSDTARAVARLQSRILERMAGAADPAALRGMVPELRAMVDEAVDALQAGLVPTGDLALSRRLSKPPEEYERNTGPAMAVRELSGRGVALHPGSRIRYILAEEGRGKRPVQSARAAGFLDGGETPDVARYAEMMREAGEELIGLL